MEFTGERYVPSLGGEIKYEHLHRYALCIEFIQGKKVLDIASGEGYGSALLARYAQSVIGVDISPEAIDYAAQEYSNYHNLKFIVGSCDAVPLPNNSVEVVTSFETIEHHDKHQEMMLEIKRVLKPEGVLIISSPNRLTYSDEPNYKNPFHIKELYYEEFICLLSQHFKYVQIYGQKLAVGSFIFSTENDKESSFKAYTGSINDVSHRIYPLESPLYFIAVCSDEQPVTKHNIDSIYIDGSDDIFKKFYTELQKLYAERQQFLASLEQMQRHVQHTQVEFERSQLELQQVHAELGRSHLQLQQKQVELEQSDLEFQQKQAELVQSHSQLQQTQAELVQSHSQLQQKQVELAQSHLQLQETQAELAQSHLQLQQTQTELAQSHLQLQQTQTELAQSHSQLQQTQTELAQAHSQLQQTQEELAQVYLRLQLTKEELAQSNSDLQTVQTELLKAYEQLQQTQNEIAQTHSQLQQRQAELELVQCHIQQRQDREIELQQARDRIKAMESSKFWKLRTVWFKFKKSLGLKNSE
ncbi:hypothetical protein NUACC21_76750 [Scytonema sp. NUACC21]